LFSLRHRKQGGRHYGSYMTDDEARELIKGSRNGFRIGDKLERVFRLVGIKRAAKLYEAKTGRSCGCDKRKQALNRII